MTAIIPPEHIDYLVIGHISCDITEDGLILGGTASYAALTAKAIGLKVGIITSWGGEISPGPLIEIPTINQPAEASTTFENIYTNAGRTQIIHKQAAKLDSGIIPNGWKNTPIVHLGPIAREVKPDLVGHFRNSLIGITPQGWLRTWDDAGRIVPADWSGIDEFLSQADVVVISTEDVGNDEAVIQEISTMSPIFVVTRGYLGARVYWHGDVRRFNVPQVEEVDATGSGDIFAAAFFIQYHKTKNPWEAARFANRLAAQSVTREGLASVPSTEEVKHAISEVL